VEQMLTIKEVSDILKVNERTIHRLIQAGTIPASKVGNQWRFHPLYLEEWLIRGGASESEETGEDHASQWHEEKEFQVLAEERVCLDLVANCKEDAICQLIDRMVDTGHLLQGTIYYNAVLEREKISTTGIGNGVALPHGWHPINDLFRVPLIACARLKEPIDFKAVDGKPVDLIFLLCCPRNRTHLKVLRSLSVIASDQEILRDLRKAKTAIDFISPLTENVVSQL